MAGNEVLDEAVKQFPIRRWLPTVLPGYDVSGESIRCTCPTCGRKNAMKISIVGKWYKCYGCANGEKGKGFGGLIKLIELLTKVSTREAIQVVLRTVGFPDTYVGDSEHVEIPRVLPKESRPLNEAYATHPARSGLARRGVQHIEPHIYYCSDGRYRGRWILPVLGDDNELLGFDAKTYLGGVTPKSLLSDWMDPGTIYKTLSWDSSLDYCVITESVFDAETLGCNACGLFGSNLRQGQLTNLLRMRRRGISRLVWFLDYDAWYKQANMILRNTNVWFTNYVVSLEKGQDPNSLGSEKSWKLVSEAREVQSIADVLVR